MMVLEQPFSSPCPPRRKRPQLRPAKCAVSWADPVFPSLSARPLLPNAPLAASPTRTLTLPTQMPPFYLRLPPGTLGPQFESFAVPVLNLRFRGQQTLRDGCSNFPSVRTTPFAR